MSGRTEIKRIVMGVGDPIAQSLSPAMHGAALKALHLEDQFEYLLARVPKGALAPVISGARAMNFRGITCTKPHKQDVIEFLDECDPAAAAIGAVNTVVNQDGRLKGYNTDWIGIVDALGAVCGLSKKRIAILGAGGTARAACYGVKARGAKTTIFNRTVSKAKDLSLAFDCEYFPLEESARLKQFDILLNTTSVGMAPESDISPVPPAAFVSGQVVMDVVYNPVETRFIALARSAGATVINGVSMFLLQALSQFELYFERKAPRDVMAAVLCKKFGLSSL